MLAINPCREFQIRPEVLHPCVLYVCGRFVRVSEIATPLRAAGRDLVDTSELDPMRLGACLTARIAVGLVDQPAAPDRHPALAHPTIPTDKGTYMYSRTMSCGDERQARDSYQSESVWTVAVMHSVASPYGGRESKWRLISTDWPVSAKAAAWQLV